MNSIEVASPPSYIEKEKEDWLHQLQPCTGLGGPKRTHVVEVNEGPSSQIIRHKRRKDDGPLAICCGWVVEHQIGILLPLLTFF